MSKNVRIDHESTQGTYSGVDKLRVSERDFGSVDWVPQEKYADYIEKGTITITENGTYKASDFGYNSFSGVTVQFGDALGEIELDDGTDLDTAITYELPDIDLSDLLDPEIPEIPDIPSVDVTYTDVDIEDFYPAVDWNPVDVEDVSVEIPDAPIDTITLNEMEGPGTITGIDPTTGIATTISTDMGGNIVKTPVVPEGIIVTNPPDTLEYNDGDEIDYTGIVVCAYRSIEGRVPFSNPDWDGPRHNQVPFSELVFPITVASASGGKNSDLDTGKIEQPISIGSSFTIEYDYVSNYEPWHKSEYSCDYLIASSRPVLSQLYLSIIVASVDQNQSATELFYDYRTGQIISNTYELTETFTRNGKTVYWRHISRSSSGLVYSLDGNYVTPWKGYLTNEGGAIAWTMVYGDNAPSDNSIPVQWQTDYQTEPYEDTFDITVT